MFFYLFIIALLLSCETKESPQERHKRQELVFNIYSEPPTLDPNLVCDTTSGLITSMLFEGLLKLQPSKSMGIAKRYELSDDGTVYTFYLKKTKWSNGLPLTAHDFAFAWRLALIKSSETTHNLYFIKNAAAIHAKKSPIEELGVEVIDDYTLQVTLEHPTPFFLELLHQAPYLPICEAIATKDPNWALEAKNYICNGPFTLLEWTHNNQILLQKNPNFWEAENVQLNLVKALIIQDSTTEIALFEDGTIDWTGRPVSIGIPTDALMDVKASGRLQTYTTAATYFYLFNTTRPPFTNKKMRQAFAMAINRRELIESITKNEERVATSLVPPSLLQKSSYFKDGDILQAKSLFEEGLKELGMTRETLPVITLSYNTSEAHHKFAQAIQQQWREAFAVEIKLENQEWKVYLSQLQQQNFSLARMSWQANYNDAYTFLENFKYREDQVNQTGWEDPEYIELLDRSFTTKDPTERIELFKRAEHILLDAMPLIPIYFSSIAFLAHPKLKSYYISPLGEVDFRYAYFEP